MAIVYLKPGESVAVGFGDVVVVGGDGTELSPADAARLQAQAWLRWAAGLGVDTDRLTELLPGLAADDGT